jgi:nucleotide-binding universal stress UspA family protein
MKILFCSDGSGKAERAIRFGARIAIACRAESSILGIAEKPGDEETLRQALQSSREIFTKHHREAQLIIETGRPVKEIVKHCKKTPYDLVVVGAAHSSDFWRLLDPMWMGVRIYKILEYVKVPVLVVIGEPRALRRILVCTGGASYINKAIQFAGNIAKCSKAEVNLFHVMPPTPGMYVEMFQSEEDPERMLASNSDLGRNLRQQKGLLQEFGVFGEIRLRQGEMIPELLQELHEKDYDLVVIGSVPAEDLLSRYVMSNLTQEIINRVMHPVLVVRTKQRLMHRLFNEIRFRLFS